jgi:hypothetical protein
LPLEAFWTALILLDAGVVALLLAGWRRSGLLAALIIMTCCPPSGPLRQIWHLE